MHFLILVFFICTSISSFASEVVNIDEGLRETYTDCGPVRSPESILSLDTAVICSPAVLYGGVQHFRRLSGAPLTRAATKLAAKTSVRVGSYLLGGVGIAITAYDIISLALSISATKCDRDSDLKKALMLKVNVAGDNLIKASEGEIYALDKFRVKFPNTFLKESYLKKVTCHRLASMIRAKKQSQLAVWYSIVGKTRRDRNLTRRLRTKRIRGIHRQEIDTRPLILELEDIAKSASCLPLKNQIEVACALGTVILVGTAPSKKLIARLRQAGEESNTKMSMQAIIGSSAREIRHIKESKKDGDRLIALNEYGELVGSMYYVKSANTAKMGLIKSHVKKKGVASYLFLQFVKENPNVKTISTTLTRDNKNILEGFLHKGLKCKDAMRRTPAFKIRKKSGFTKIVSAKCVSGEFSLTVSRP